MREIFFVIRLDRCRINLDTRAHRGGQRDALEIDALRRGWLVLLHSFHEGGEVFRDLRCIERGLGDRLVEVGGLVVLEGDLTLLDVLNHLFDVRAHRVSLWVWHEAGWTEELCDLGHLCHHVRRSNGDVEVDFSGGGELSDEFFATDDFCTGFTGVLFFVGAYESGDFLRLTDGVREDDRGADLLVTLLHVDTEVDVHFNRAVELRGSELLGERDRFFEFVEFLTVNVRFECCVAFAAGHSGIGGLLPFHVRKLVGEWYRK